MPEQPLISVRGEAVVKVEPEIARLEVSVVSRDADRAAALRLLEERVEKVTKILASFPDVIDAIDNTGLRVSPQLSNRRPPEKLPGFVGIARLSVVVTGFERIGELMAELTGLELTEVGGPWWELRPDSPVYKQARISAVRDAIVRASDYAEGLGCQLTGLVELADARMMSDGGIWRAGRAFYREAAAAYPGGGAGGVLLRPGAGAADGAGHDRGPVPDQPAGPGQAGARVGRRAARG